MAPLPPVLGFLFGRRNPSVAQPAVSDLTLSSLELDSRSSQASAFFASLHTRNAALDPSSSDLTTTPTIVKRATTTVPWIKGAGSKPPQDFNGPGYITLFALLGTAMVVASIWFFFWAKNGGFHFQQHDWDDYKSTVLRRKGPDGKTLSNATKSTRLGGGSVVHGQDYMRAKSVARTVVGKDEKGRKGILAKRGWGKTHSVWGGSDEYQTESWGTETVSDEMTELRSDSPYKDRDEGHGKRYRDRDVHHYKREKVARVGGLNRVADGSHYDYTNSDRSDAYTDVSAEPLVSKTRKPSARASQQPAHTTRDHTRNAHEEAERNAKIEAAKMERRWKREAEEAAASLARENNHRAPSPRKVSTPATGSPSAQKLRRDSRSASPKKRDFSYQQGAPSEVLSSAYTGSNSESQRTASYYDAYRPRNQGDGYVSDGGRGARGSRQNSPVKKGRREGGYRRGADSDLD
ncbi:hypothetical protein LTR95_016280 [Oleoguttula sp. CCFEE 5521]